MGVGTKRAYDFDRGFLGDMGRLLQCLRGRSYLEVLGDPVKNGDATDCCIRNNFQEGYGHYIYNYTRD